ncbi:MAG: putative urea ABC transporter substrate-binding protein [Paracoccaceae bacterium]
MTRLDAAILLALAAPVLAATPAPAQEKDSFRVAWSIYVGWMPWGYMAESGIIDRHAEKEGISIEVVQINDYIESINQYTAGAFDGVSATNMDTLSIPAGGGVDTTALIVGDYSNGNDAILTKRGEDVASLEGKSVHLVELSVSHYLLARALDENGLAERDLSGVVNTSDADMVGAWQTPEVEVAVTWNPLVQTILDMGGANRVYDSADIPGEIIDLMVVNTETLEANPAFGRALVGAWYETIGLMQQGDEEALTAMAEAAGTDLEGYMSQLATTEMFYAPADAVTFVENPKLKETMQYVAEFLFEHGILGEGAPSADFVGIEYPDGSVIGNPDNVNFRFTSEYMRLAADGELSAD